MSKTWQTTLRSLLSFLFSCGCLFYYILLPHYYYVVHHQRYRKRAANSSSHNFFQLKRSVNPFTRQIEIIQKFFFAKNSKTLVGRFFSIFEHHFAVKTKNVSTNFDRNNLYINYNRYFLLSPPR